MNSKPHIVSFVFNKVAGDSRVIKTAQAALDAGYHATIVGVGATVEPETTTVEGVPVRLLPNYSASLKRNGLWGAGRRDLRLLIGGQIHTALPEIIALAPDLIHSHDMNGIKVGAAVSKALSAGGTPIPWVHDLHEYVAGLRGDLAEAYMPICLAWERELLHQTDALITVSDALARRTAARYKIPEPEVVYNVPNAGDFSEVGGDIRTHIGLDAHVPLVVFVGGATVLRGCPTIVEGVSMCEGVHLAFLSQGAYVDEMRALAQSLGMSDRFHVHPYVTSDRVSTFIRTADVGIHGLVHYPNAEVALPNKLFEYLHARLPVVVSDVESMKAFVERFGVGECFEADNASSCAVAVRKVLGDRKRYKSAINSSLLQTYSWEAQAQKIRSIYSRLLSAPKTVTHTERHNAIAWEKADTTLFEAVYARALSERADTSSKAILAVESRILKALRRANQEPAPSAKRGYVEKFFHYGPRASLRQAWRRLKGMLANR